MSGTPTVTLVELLHAKATLEHIGGPLTCPGSSRITFLDIYTSADYPHCYPPLQNIITVPHFPETGSQLNYHCSSLSFYGWKLCSQLYFTLLGCRKLLAVVLQGAATQQPLKSEVWLGYTLFDTPSFKLP